MTCTNEKNPLVRRSCTPSPGACTYERPPFRGAFVRACGRPCPNEQESARAMPAGLYGVIYADPPWRFPELFKLESEDLPPA
jgi:hypothetical protein